LDLKGVPFRATVVGPGALLEPHRRLAARLGLDGTVSIPGRVDDVAPYLAEADVYVLPSRAEASGSVSVLEALHAGVAVVASACDGMPEDLTDGRDALLVAPGDPAALARALETVLGDRALRARIAAAGRRRYEERFSADGFVAALAEVWAGARGVVEAGVVADDGEVAKAGGVSATGEITRPAGGPAGADLTDQGPPQRGRIPSGSP
jgi:glycosyltransferase involved in cell wall biosynthesis